MNIIDKTKGTTTFGELSIGDVFKRSGTIFMVTDYTKLNSVSLQSGSLYHFAPDDEVTVYENPTIILE